MWRQGLEPLVELAELRVIQMSVDPAVAHARYSTRGVREAQGTIIGTEIEDWCNAYERLSLPLLSIEVDATEGYQPSFDEIIEFVNDGRQDG